MDKEEENTSKQDHIQDTMKGMGENAMVADQDQTILFTDDQRIKGARISGAELEMVLGMWR